MNLPGVSGVGVGLRPFHGDQEPCLIITVESVEDQASFQRAHPWKSVGGYPLHIDISSAYVASASTAARRADLDLIAPRPSPFQRLCRTLRRFQRRFMFG